jgi:hypothetical protein
VGLPQIRVEIVTIRTFLFFHADLRGNRKQRLRKVRRGFVAESICDFACIYSGRKKNEFKGKKSERIEERILISPR